MNVLTLAVLLAVAAVIVSLTSGIAAMARNGEIAHQSSAAWMGWRVLLQAVALLLVLIPHTPFH